jgi:pSer/pThr/pTyr-binding forkhead associated (FHA) protein
MTTTLTEPITAPGDALTGRLDGASRPAPVAPGAPAADLPAGRYLLARCGGETELIALTGDVTHVGRGLTADVRLDDHVVSRRHAVLVLRGTQMYLIDDRSANGVVLNGRVVCEAPLHHGDVIVLGRSVLRYLDYRRCDAVTPSPCRSR